MGEVVSLAESERVCAEARGAGRRIVLTNGYFDLLHVGHLRYLQQARALGDLLIVGVNADATARRAKDPRRPIVPEDERAELLAGLACVDYVVIFTEDTAEALVVRLSPDVYTKGADYSVANLPEANVVRAYGGRVELLPFHESRSTTNIVDTILDRYRQ
jgi:rfaE bifunctional protein nucleotidyltransferase chain/domain